jgi:hypothetical protein
MAAVRTVVLLTVLLAAACARSDLGAPCHVENAAGAELIPLPGRQYLYLGSSECDSFACLATQGSTGEGGSCPSGMSCTQLAVNQQYLAALKARLPADRYQQLFGQLGSTWYCLLSR